MIDAWNLFTGAVDVAESPSKIFDYTFEQKDVYEAIIMDLLEKSYDIRLMECIDNELTEEAKALTDIISGDMKNLYNYENVSALKNICDMDNDFINQLQKTITDDFNYEHGNTSAISKLSSFIGDTIKYAKDLESYCERLIAYCDMLQMSSSMKNVINQMYTECPLNNPSLKAALLECRTLINLGEDEFEKAMVAEFFGVVGKDVTVVYFDKMWDGIKTKFMITNPEAYVLLAAYKTGHYITNTAFNTDTISEKYYKLAVVNEVESLLKQVYHKTIFSVNQNKTEETAKNYNTLVDIMFKMMELDCVYSVDYLNETDDTLVADIKHIFGNNDTQDAIAYVESLKGKYDRFHESVLADWILTLPQSYPDLFTRYMPMLKDSIEKRKAYFIHCPVDVYIYDSEGNLVGSVENNVPYCDKNADITISVCGDKKTIYMHSENEYNIVYKGNDSGTMDITINEYDETNSVARNINFNDIDLIEGLTYTASEPGTSSNENIYSLTNEAAESIAPDFDSVTDIEKETYTTNISGGYFADTMTVSQELHCGENIYITAYVPEGYKFLNWTSDTGNSIFDNESNITTKITVPNYNVNITANFVLVPTLSVSSITENSATVKATGCDSISDGKIILAIYDENETLKQLKTINYTDEFTFSELKLTNGKAKAMLWHDWNDLVPLTETSEKWFYFASEAG